ncbi:MAG TPA: omptin family outer membrane protease, partial [candidate division Zixibacteria bacterium]|nr:omptin family outer membrane protease [candidate division Zixibacteria bacterium]
MNRILIALLLCLAATPPSPTANVKPRVSLQPSLRYGFGETEYVLDARWYDDEGVLQHLKSQLEFPLDGLYAGLEGRVRWNPASTKPWDSKLSVSTNLSDPAGDMTDRDWSTFWESGSETFYLPSFTELSSTVSSAESRSWVVAAEVGKVLAAGPKGSIRLFAGYRYQHIAQKAIGISGWQMVNVGGELVKGYFDGSRDGTTFIDYEVTFHSPQAGLGLSLAVTDRAAVAARAAYAPVFASDRDDHVVRNFLSEASI